MVLFLMTAARWTDAETAVFWASDPIGPGETALTIGEGFGENPGIEVVRLIDGPAAEPTAHPSRGLATDSISKRLKLPSSRSSLHCRPTGSLAYLRRTSRDEAIRSSCC